MQNDENAFSSNSPGYCECCLSKNKLKLMTQSTYNSNVKEIYYDMLIECFSSEILSRKAVEDCSMYICEECITKLRDSYDFCIQIKATQKKLIDFDTENIKLFTFDGIKLEYSVKNEKINIPFQEYNCVSPDNEYASDNPIDTCTTKTGKKYTDKKNASKRNNGLNAKKKPNRVYKNSTVSESVNSTPAKSKTVAFSKSKNDTAIKIDKSDNLSKEGSLPTVLPTVLPNELNVDCSDVNSLSPESSNDGFFENVQKYLDKISKRQKRNKKKTSDTVAKMRTEEEMIQIRARDRQKRVDKRPFKIDKTDLVCQVCNKELLTNRCLMIHMNEHFPMHVCDQCGKGFTLRTALREHIKTHGEKVPCNVCNKFFIKTSIRTHMLRHLGKKDFHPCHMCDMRFESPYKLTTHIEKVHKIVKKYTCETCGKTFNMSDKYRIHLRRHNPHYQPSINNAFECDICQKTFPTRSHLWSHKNVHVTERKYQCHLCPRNYKVKALLNRHLREHDDNSDKYVCSVCNRSFVVKHLLKRHLFRVHKIKIDINTIVPTVVENTE